MSILSTIKDINRLRTIITILVRHGFGHIIERLNLNDIINLGTLNQNTDPTDKNLNPASRLRTTFIDLGPTFIKLGQTMSTRSDLFPPEWITELRVLQDQVPPFESTLAREVVEEELRAPLPQLFKSFDEAPIASASMGQVHRAVTLGDEQVVVKIQRPGIRQVIEADLDILHTLAVLLEKSIPESRVFQPVDVVKEFDRVIRREIDFTIEANNARRLHNVVENLEGVRVPLVFSRLSSRRVLTMEYIEGVRLHAYAEVGLEAEQVAKRIITAMFHQIFEEGFFHSDPHPGNLALTRAGELVFFDFGQMGRINERLRDQIMLLLLSIAREDREGVANAFYDVGIKTRAVDLNEFRQDVDDVLDRIVGKELDELHFGPLFKELISKAERHKMRVPSNFSIVGKACITLEDVVRTLCPSIKLFDELKPKIQGLILKRWSLERLTQDAFKLFYQVSSLSQSVPFSFQDLVGKFTRGDFSIKVQDLEAHHLASTLRNLGAVLSFTFLTSALFLGSSLLVVHGILPEGWFGLGASAAFGVLTVILVLFSLRR